MQRSSTKILTSHAGSLPRPDALIEANRARAAGEASDEAAFQAQLEAAVADVVAHFKAGLKAAGASEGFMTSIAPGSCSRIANKHYATEDDFLFACADAMREEYKAIIDAGLILQLDDPSIAENWDQINPEPTIEEYKKFSMVRVESLNHAIGGLPQDRIRFHFRWGSWHGPRVTDILLP